VRRSAYSNSTFVSSLAPAAARTASADGATVDRHGAALNNYRSAMLVVHAGVVTDGTHAFKVQVSDDDSNWADADASHLQGSAISVTSANDETVYTRGYNGPARYLRAVSTVTGSPSTGGLYSAGFVLLGPRRVPRA
jgi:hypothetical protein